VTGHFAPTNSVKVGKMRSNSSTGEEHMPNDREWERHSSEWVRMSQESRRRKEASGRSLQRTETNLTDLEHEQNPEPFKTLPHGRAVPPQKP
jgi:hypothetical protein